MKECLCLSRGAAGFAEQEHFKIKKARFDLYLQAISDLEFTRGFGGLSIALYATHVA